MKKTDFKIDENGQKWRRLGNICWFTNLEIEKRHQFMTLYKHYSPDEYPKYDNDDAIEVSRTVDIPADYNGIMGVPITFWINIHRNSLKYWAWMICEKNGEVK